MHPFVHLSVVFWLYMVLQYQSSMSSNFLVFYTSGGISSSPAAFIFLIFLCTKSSSSSINCPSLISSWLLIIFVIGSSITFGGFQSKFSKCCFHRCIRSSWLVVFFLALVVLTLPSTHFVYCLPCYPRLFMFSRVSNLIDLILYVCSCMYTLANSFCALLSFWVLILVGFLLLHRGAVFMSGRFFLTANVSHGTLGLALCLVGMYSIAALRRQWRSSHILHSE